MPPGECILFFEDVNERPYRLHRMLTQLRLAGVLARARALVFGEMRGCDEPGGHVTAIDAIREATHDFNGPILHRVPVRPHHGAVLDAAARRAGARRGVGRHPLSWSRIPPLSDVKRIHLIGVCGTAMATLAALLKQRGHDVRGSDQNVYPPMSDFLAAEDIRTFSGYSADHLEESLDLVVVGNAISRGNPELEAVLERRLRYCSLPEAIREFFLWDAAAGGGRRHARQDHDDVAHRLAADRTAASIRRCWWAAWR